MSNARNLARLLPNASGQLPDAAMSSGSVLQVVQGSISSPTATTSTSYVTTGLSASITPAASTNKILVLVSSGVYVNTSGVQSFQTIYRNSTDLASPSTAGITQTYSGASSLWGSCTMSVLDSPATTSSTNYTVYFKVSSGSSQFGNDDGGKPYRATITLMEIAA